MREQMQILVLRNNTIMSVTMVDAGAGKKGKTVVLQATPDVTYEIKGWAQGFAPDQILIRRNGNHLELVLDVAGKQEEANAPADIVIENYYQLETPSPITGLSEDGNYYPYVPQEGDGDLLSWHIAEGATSYQSLGHTHSTSTIPLWPLLLLAAAGAAGAAVLAGGKGGTETPDTPNPPEPPDPEPPDPEPPDPEPPDPEPPDPEPPDPEPPDPQPPDPEPPDPTDPEEAPLTLKNSEQSAGVTTTPTVEFESQRQSFSLVRLNLSLLGGLGGLLDGLLNGLLGNGDAALDLSVTADTTDIRVEATNGNLLALNVIEGTAILIQERNASGTWVTIANSKKDAQLINLEVVNGQTLVFTAKASELGLDPAKTYRVILAQDSGLAAQVAQNWSMTVQGLKDVVGSQDATGNFITEAVIEGDPVTMSVTAVKGANAVVVPVSAGNAQVIDGLYGKLTIAADGSYTYTPQANTAWIGRTDTFELTVSNPDKSERANLVFLITDAGASTMGNRVADAEQSDLLLDDTDDPATAQMQPDMDTGFDFDRISIQATVMQDAQTPGYSHDAEQILPFAQDEGSLFEHDSLPETVPVTDVQTMLYLTERNKDDDWQSGGTVI